MEKILFVDVILKERIWGGDNLNKRYNQNEQAKIGEAWIFSGHRNGQSKVINGKYKGIELNELYLENKAIFGNSNYDRFPLLIKIIDAKDDLSVQVHPNDDYALKHHNDLGKNECWYILDAKADAKIVYGHKAKSASEFKNYIDNNKIDEILNYITVKNDEFYNIKSGTVHAIGSGIEILEVQQSSDTTYRLYDYNRVDSAGNKRELHIERALDVIDYNNDNNLADLTISNNAINYISNDYFSVTKTINNKLLEVSNNNQYIILYAHKENAIIKIDNKNYELQKGYTALIPAYIERFELLANGEVFIITEKALSIKNIKEI